VLYNQCAVDFSTMRWPPSKRIPHHLRMSVKGDSQFYQLLRTSTLVK
jgi:hypothetical protein